MENLTKKINEQLEAITKVLERFKDGASIEVLKATSELNYIGLRSLQRRLTLLQTQGRIRTSGSARSTLYHIVKNVPGDTADENLDENSIPLTDESKRILSRVSNPEMFRHPVGYNREFLELYRPNIDSYLKPEELSILATLGRTPQADQPAGTYIKVILNRLLIELSWNSSRLEGNTYSLLDTERLLASGQTADKKSAKEAQMILNHKDAIEFLAQEGEEIGFNRYTILNLHAILSHNLFDDAAASGRLRSMVVAIGNSVYTPLGIPQVIEEMFEMMLEKAQQIKNPFEQAFFIMVQLPYLQPFDDVNKRVSRLAANIPLIRYNLAPLSFIDVPKDLYIAGLLGVYEMGNVELFKDVFLWAYQRSALRYTAMRHSLGEPDPFRLKYREAIRELITAIILQAFPYKKASALIQSRAMSIAEKDRVNFIQAVETELLSLHEGNFARYKIRPSEFKRWQEVWNDRQT